MTKLKTIKKNKPICLGSGLVALDVILNGTPATPAKLCAGGSCGNIISILSYLGWNSKPIARLSKNNATKNLLKDLNSFNVNTDLLSKALDGSTPIIIHRILRDREGNPKHRFEFRVPGTSTWLPSYKPVLSSTVESITKEQKQAQVFYFDRVSRSSIDLGKYYKEKGALIVFEPSSYNETKQFHESLSIADIVKFSSDRIGNYSEIFPTPIAPLEIETRGKEGLQYRLQLGTKKGWQKTPPYKLTNIMDTAGAGDWCTAGIINELGQNGAKSFYSAGRDQIERALDIGQALGALNCIFDGARGIMYNMDRKILDGVIPKIISKKEISNIPANTTNRIITIKNFHFDTLLQ